MKVIHKYTLPFMEKSNIMMPDGAIVIRCDGMDGFLFIWAIVDTDNQLINREFFLFKTGAQMPDDILDKYQYLGCGAIFVQMELMMYIFEEIHVQP